MKHINSLLPLFYILLPSIGIGQMNCENDQIDLLRLDLKPAFQNWATIQIDCDSSRMDLNLKIYTSEGDTLSNKTHEIPIELYKEFKQKVLPLDITSMKNHSNLYMLDGLEAEITYIDWMGNFNRFVVRIPMKRIRNIILIESIISLTEQLEINEEDKKYFEELRDWYLNY